MSEETTSLFGDLDLEQAADDPFAIPDNSYVAYLTDVKVGLTKAGDKTGMTLTYTIDGGQYNGMLVSEWKQIPSPADPKNPSDEELRSMSFIKQRLLSLGIPRERINAIEPTDLIGTRVVIAVRSKNGYTNIRDLTVVDENFQPESDGDDPFSG